jgi:hypothetical protein
MWVTLCAGIGERGTKKREKCGCCGLSLSSV